MIKSPLSVILPTLNESENIKPLVYKIIKLINPRELIIVDDNSIDGTQQKINELLIKFPQVKTVINNPPIGLTNSIQLGISKSTSRYIAWMDADFSHPPETLLKMINKIYSCDLVVGSWYKKGGEDKRKEKIVRLMSLAINKICQLLFNNNITTYTSGFILLKKHIIKSFQLKGDYGEYCIDLLVRMSAKKYKISEVSFVCRSRIKGVSKTSPNLFIYIKRSIRYLTIIFSLHQYILKKR